MKKAGFIYTWRSLQKHWLWKDKPFSQGQAWVDLLLRASHKDHEYSHHRSKPICQKKGEFITSIADLSTVWGWSRGKTKRFLNILKMEQMIEYQTDMQKTTIYIINYKELQNNDIPERTQNGHKTDSRRTVDGHQTDSRRTQSIMINNDNTENNEDRESTLNTDMPYKMPDPTTGCKLVQSFKTIKTIPPLPDTFHEEYVAGLKAKEQKKQDMIKQAKELCNK